MAWETKFLDGFDHYNSAAINAKWDVVGNGGEAINTTIFRNSGQSLQIGYPPAQGVGKSVAQVRNFVVGFGFRTPAITTATTLSSNGSGLLGFTNSLNLTGVGGQCGLGFLSDGKLRAVRGDFRTGSFSSPTELGVGSTTIATNQWYYIEVRVFIDNTAGEFEVKVNGITEINLTGIDTQHMTENYASVVSVMGGDNSTPRYYDDVYIRTSSSSTAEAGGFLGDIKVKPFYPNADGTYSEMTPSTGTTHNTLVDEALATTSDYVSSNTAGQRDSYGFQDISESGSVKAVQLSAYVAKDDAGFRSVDLFTKSGATEDFAAAQPLSVTPLYRRKIWEKNPNTTNDWSQAEVNAAEFGVRISSGT